MRTENLIKDRMEKLNNHIKNIFEQLKHENAESVKEILHRSIDESLAEICGLEYCLGTNIVHKWHQDQTIYSLYFNLFPEISSYHVIAEQLDEEFKGIYEYDYDAEQYGVPDTDFIEKEHERNLGINRNED